ncbi:OLC1v1022251C1 [Oldenlandia corymbosa var. corymbosa]|uniref:OLC1v1022251C1 n=1 Tax=Oldenlandia corymbosa var. corymbosa TaxID=529605 RepID=A0AAV1BXG2_OLDCO|nr:OLC1v1022251C1 [Oldenlandia corymbosa var. corymbosa]
MSRRRLPFLHNYSASSVTTNTAALSSTSSSSDSSVVNADAEDVMAGYIFGKKKATQVAHSLWKHVVRKGDVVIDATCGNGHDALALQRLVSDATRGGRVYAVDIQKAALESTSLLLDRFLSPDEREHVELFLMCHSKMEEIIPSGVAVRLVAFNLGYLPGGEKALITRSETTLLALEAAKRILAPGGLISIVVYVGHQGGREEFEAVQSFASELPLEEWVCCKLQTINRPFAPIMVLLYRR